MFCPECRAEYEEGFTLCSDCHVELVAELPPEDVLEYADWVTVLSTGDANEAMVAESVLGAAGIECNIQGWALRSLVPVPTAPVTIQVRPDDAETALGILAEHLEMDPESEDAQEAIETSNDSVSAENAGEVMADDYAAEQGLTDEPAEEAEYVDCVTVLSPKNEEELMVAQSVLGAAGIPCYAKGQLIQDLFAWGRMGAGYNLAAGPVEIQVRAEDAEEALRILGEKIEVPPESE